jgi:hypothetical protein
MAQNTDITVEANDWTLLTDSNVSSVTFQNQSPTQIFVKATADTTKPTTALGSIEYGLGEGERNVLLSDLFPGITAPVRLWAYANLKANVYISHA